MNARLCLILSLTLCLPALAAQTTWLKAYDGSLARTGHAMAQFNGRVWSLGGRAPDASPTGTTSPAAGPLTSEIWSSQDGIQWTMESVAAPWSARMGLTAIEFNGRLWVIGGGPDIWSSADGVNWACECASPAFGHRLFHSCVVFNNQLWVMGGLQMGVAFETSDVWASSDGVNWTQMAVAPWAARRVHGSVVFNNRIWVLGGSTSAAGGPFLNSVWSSTDGVTWTEETASAPWTARDHFGVVTHNGRMYVAGGNMMNGNTQSQAADVWSSADGINWSVDSYYAVWQARSGPVIVERSGEMWLFGGIGADGVGFTDAWSSPDGDTWTRQANPSGLPPRRAYSAYCEFNGALWMVAGVSSAPQTTHNDVWRSENGMNWTCVLRSAPFTPRAHATLEVLNGRMYLLGGESDQFTILGDAWSSADGANWTQETGAAWPLAGTNFSALTDHRSTVHNGRLWVMGGITNLGTRTGNVWSSADGATWTLEGTGFPIGGYLEVQTLNNCMWAVGGTSTIADPGRREAWSSTDGVTWTRATAAAPWGTRATHGTAIHNGRIWLTGGMVGTTHGGWSTGVKNDTWSSADGVNWTLEAPAAAYTACRYMGYEVLNGELWKLGGLGGRQDQWRYVENCQAPQISGAPASSVIAGCNFSYAPALAGTSYLKLSVTGAPAWLETNAATGELAGTPPMTDIGNTFAITLTLTNAFGTDTQAFQVTVLGPPPQITSTPFLTAVAGTPYTYTVSTAGGPPAPTLIVAGLPAWLTFDANTSTLSGTPTVADLGTTGPITITASNGTNPDAVQTFQVTVVGVAPQFTTTPVLEGQVGVFYSYTVAATGLPAPTLSAGSLPPGLSFDPVTGVLSGIPTSAQGGMTELITIVASNGEGPDAVQSFRIDLSGQFDNGGGGADGAGCTLPGTAAPLWAIGALLALVAAYRRRHK